MHPLPTTSLTGEGCLDAALIKGIGAVDIAHSRLRIFPADLFHQGFQIPTVGRGPTGESSADDISDEDGT